MMLSVVRDGRHRIACGCMVFGFALLVLFVLVWVAGGFRSGARFFLPSWQQDVTIEFLSFNEKQSRVNKLVLLERQSSEKLVKTVNNTYKVPGIDGLEFSDSATMSLACPVSYSYYVDLKEPWHLVLRNGDLTVSAPALRLARPSVDIGRVKRDIQGGWLVFGEDRMLQELERELVVRLYQQANRPENLDKIRESCRASLEDFIRAWAVVDKRQIKSVSIRFAGEKDPVRLPERGAVTTAPVGIEKVKSTAVVPVK